jgi:hypothetical protein
MDRYMPIFSEEFQRGLYERIKNIPHAWIWALAFVPWLWGYWISEMAVLEARDYCVAVAADYLAKNGYPPSYCVNVAYGFIAKMLADIWLGVVMNVFFSVLFVGFFLSIIRMILMEKYKPDHEEAQKKTITNLEELK